VAKDAVHSLDHDPIGFLDRAQDLSLLSFFVARDDLDDVIRADFHHGHTTSAAREMIFMKFLERSSRATAPKMRVPLGLFSVSSSTIAFLSKRTIEPSSRRIASFVRT